MTHRRWFNGLRSRAAIGVAVFGLVAGMTLATAGTGATTAGAASKYTITLIPGLTTDPFYITMHYGAIQEAKKLGVNLKWAGATTWSLELQIPVVKSVLASKPNALLIAPTDDVALFNPIDQFVKAGIPVIAVDTTLKNTSILASAISSDNYQGGEAAADAIAKLAHDKGPGGDHQRRKGRLHHRPAPVRLPLRDEEVHQHEGCGRGLRPGQPDHCRDSGEGPHPFAPGTRGDLRHQPVLGRGRR